MMRHGFTYGMVALGIPFLVVGSALAQETGSIVGWGSMVIGEPSAHENLTAIAGDGYHSLGLKADSAIVAWGSNGFGECLVPAPNAGFVAVAPGRNHSLCLKRFAFMAAPVLSITHDETSITLSWDPVPNANSYQVDSSPGAYWGFTEDLSGVFLGTTWQTPMIGDERYYRVVTMGFGQESDPSNHVGFLRYQGDIA